MKPTDLATHLSAYLSTYLPGQKNVSTNTVKSYRDTFKLLLIFSREYRNIPVERLKISNLDDKFILGFLDWLETQRGNGISTRNQRLAAIHAFFRYLQIEEPSVILQSQRILAISSKKTEKPTINHLTPEALKVLLSQPDKTAKSGRRDLTILTLLYDTGARVEELVGLKVRDVRLDSPAIITLKGKGRKVRHVPLVSKTIPILRGYMLENRLLDDPGKYEHPLFFNQQRSKMTRGGISYILDKYAESARKEYPAFPCKLTPHVLRHTKAMHLLQAGVNLVYIRDLLGHVNISTTEIYARADNEIKRKALEAVYPDIPKCDFSEWNNDKNLLDWLDEF